MCDATAPVPAADYRLDPRFFVPPSAEELERLERRVIESAPVIDPGASRELFESVAGLEALYRRCLIHPLQGTLDFEHPFIPGQRVRDDFSNIGAHSLAVGWTARELAARAGMSAADIERATLLGALHDALKPLEILRRRAVRLGQVAAAPTTTTIRSEERAVVVERYGLSSDEADLVFEASGCACAVDEFLVIDDSGRAAIPGDDVRLLVHLADDMVYSTVSGNSVDCLVSVSTRVRLSALRYGELWRRGILSVLTESGWKFSNAVVLEDPRTETPEGARYLGNSQQIQHAISIRAAERLTHRVGAAGSDPERFAYEAVAGSIEQERIARSLRTALA